MASCSLLFVLQGAVLCLGAMSVLGRTATVREPRNSERSFQTGPDGCILSSSSSQVVPSERPWQMALLYRRRFRCEVTLVGDNWAVTAAHCVAGGNRLRMRVVPASSLGQGRQSRLRIKRHVRQVFIHPGYFSNVLGRGVRVFDNDVALLLLSCPSRRQRKGQKSDPQVHKVCTLSKLTSDPSSSPDAPHPHVPSPHFYLFLSRQGRDAAAAAGDAENQGALSADVINPDECRQRWSPSVTERMLCGRAAGNETVCRGDSGSPLVSFGLTGECHLEGIVSSGDSDCRGDSDVFLMTRMSSFLSWIEDTKGRYPHLCRRRRRRRH